MQAVFRVETIWIFQMKETTGEPMMGSQKDVLIWHLSTEDAMLHLQKEAQQIITQAPISGW